MKNVFYTALLAAMFFACKESGKNLPAGASGTGTKAPALDLSKFERSDIPGTGLQKVWTKGENGLLQEEGIVRDGKRYGTWVVFHQNKEIPRSVTNFIDDNYSGAYMEFNLSGQIELLCHYANNQLDGFFARYRNGRKIEEGSYKNGVYDGIYKKYYDGKEIAQQEAGYKNGKMHGITRFYDETGNLIMEYEYKDGEKIRGGIVEQQPKQE